MHLFKLTKSYDLVYNWFNILKNDKIEIIAYVIMPKHYKSLWVEFIIIQSLLYIGVSHRFLWIMNAVKTRIGRTFAQA